MATPYFYKKYYSIDIKHQVFIKKNEKLSDLIHEYRGFMKKEINETEIKKFNRCPAIYGTLLVLTIVPLIKIMSWYGMIPWGILYGIIVYFAFKVDKIKKDNNISTYKEIVAFTENIMIQQRTCEVKNLAGPFAHYWALCFK